jgi:hypothetical protein
MIVLVWFLSLIAISVVSGEIIYRNDKKNRVKVVVKKRDFKNLRDEEYRKMLR